MRLDLDEGYFIYGDGTSVDLRRTLPASADGKLHERDKIVGYYGSFEGALKAYVDLTARRDGGAVEILRFLVETKAAAAEIGRMMDAERKAAKAGVA